MLLTSTCVPYKSGRVISGRWVVPPGLHTYKSSVYDLDPVFSQCDQKLRLVWTHIHPCCTDVSITRCDGGSKQKMFTATVKTQTEPGFELVDIELIKPKDVQLLINANRCHTC